jgi:RNA polymerase sigma-70 factor (sigma-E family)
MAASADEEFREFMLGRWPGLVRFAYGLTGDPGLAEDLAQTTLAKAYAAWGRVRRAEDPDGYVRRILINTNKSRFRKRRVPEDSHPDPPDVGVFGDPTARLDDRAVLMAALRELTEKQRTVLLLRFWDDMSEAQAAAVLGCSVGNVKSQTARALARLRAGGHFAELSEGRLR